MKILVLGTGCAKCARAYEVVRGTVDAIMASGEATVPMEVEKVEDVMEMIRYGVMSTPAVVMDGRVVASGRVPEAAEVRGWVLEGALCAASNEEAGSCGCGCRR